MDLISALLSGYKPLIAVIHLPPLTGSPLAVDPSYVIDNAVNEARKAAEAGVDALIVENYGDKPYAVEPRDENVALMSVVVHEVVKETGLPVGVSILRLGWRAALAVATASRASFVRINSYCEVRSSPEGILNPVAAELERFRATLPRRVLVLADIDVKHSKPLEHGYNPAERLAECRERGLADAFIVTSSRTGEPPLPGYVAALKAVADVTPILVGSGVSAENIRVYWDVADGFIVGSYLKKHGVTVNSIDVRRVSKIIEIVGQLRRRG